MMRDQKPSNIIVDTDGVPRVLDFGLAKQLAGGTVLCAGAGFGRLVLPLAQEARAGDGQGIAAL